MKLKLDKVEYTTIEVGKNKIKVKTFLTTDEIKEIAEATMAQTNYVERKCVKEMLTLSKVTDIEGLDEYDYDLIECNEIYLNVFDMVMNIREVDEYIKLHESLPFVLKGLSDVLATTVDKAIKDVSKGKVKGKDVVGNVIEGLFNSPQKG